MDPQIPSSDRQREDKLQSEAGKEFADPRSISFKDEIVLGIVAPVGANLEAFEQQIDRYISDYGYKSNLIKLSDFLKEDGGTIGKTFDDSSITQHYDSLMDLGNEVRKRTKTHDFLAQYAISRILSLRDIDKKSPKPLKGQVHILHSLKHKREVETLRQVYGPGFFLVGVYCPEEQRQMHLESKGASREEAVHLILRDFDDNQKHGQQTSKVFEMSDVFIHLDSNNLEAAGKQIERFFDLIFGNPFHTPSKDENAMFLAYAASLRSGSLSRQVGAVITSAAGEIIATGTNDVPCFGGGLYGPGSSDQRDYARGYDSNTIQRDLIIKSVVERITKFNAKRIVEELKRNGIIPDEKTVELIYNPDEAIVKRNEILRGTSILNLTEFGRDVHAEMEALLCCARIGVSPKGGTLFTTTFPCHNCAKHIVAAGIERVVYVEPYPKSKAKELHSDSITIETNSGDNARVKFDHFVGVGPRRYFDLFSLALSTGRVLERKDNEGKRIAFIKGEGYPRVQMSPISYLRGEERITQNVDKVRKELKRDA